MENQNIDYGKKHGVMITWTLRYGKYMD